ncbi:MAG: PBP1A family penicillin-binding protein [Pseudomonadota bacterium]
MAPSGKKRPPLVAERRYGGTSASKKRGTNKRSAKRKTRKSRRKRGLLMRLIHAVVFGLLRLFWRIGWRVGALAAVAVAIWTAGVALTLPPLQEILDGRTRGSVTFLDRDGRVFAWRGDQFGGGIAADTVSPDLKNAIVATEDKRFYLHPGIDPRGIASAVRINMREGRGPLQGHGGSTLTQQTAKLLCLGVPFDPEKWSSEAAYETDCRQTTLWRKSKEAVYALALEVKYTKDEILTIYLNRAFLGAGARGFQAASERYFGKSAAEVSPQEAAMLAGLLVAPTRYAPTNNLTRSQERANLVLGLMQEQGYLSTTEAAAAKAAPATLSSAAKQEIGGYFADWVMSTGPDFLTRTTTEDVVIRTTFDPAIQRAAEAAMKSIFATKVREGSEAEAAIVVMSADGAVRAIVGGRDTVVSGAFNRATQAKRQTGSTFKPFVYAAAMEMGYSTRATVEDAPLTLDVPGSGAWSPKNYSGQYYGRVSLTEALARSLNTAAVRVSEFVGRDNVRQIATDFGIESDLAVGPAVALGASEATLLETTGAYAGILNGGQSVTPYGVLELRLQGDPDPLMGQEGGLGERVISRDAALKLTYMMSQVIEGGTGARARLNGRQAAGKTGTTDAARDAWFVGFTADYVAGVWMGYDDNRPLTGVTGGGLPADIWRETMLRVHDGLPARPVPMADSTAGELMADRGAPNQRPRRPRNQVTPESVLRSLIDALTGGN